MLTGEEQRELISIARRAIAEALASGETFQGERRDRAGGRGDAGKMPSGRLVEPGGAFVTLRKDHELRGCIGYIESRFPLADVVGEVAVKAAFEDPRFPPLTVSELEEITIEVSVLSPLQPVHDLEEIQVGVHGLLIELAGRRGLLLPQVASEYRWDRETFLENTARKAGLPRNAWKDPQAKIYLFSAEIAGEEVHG